MDQVGHPTALVFNLERESPFFFKCQVCGVCCTNKAIRISPYEALRLARNLKIRTADVYQTYAERGEMILRNKPDGTCIFLDSRGCSVHSDRPLVCRLFPLGQIIDGRGKPRYASMPLHPDCLGLFDTDGTVESYLESQGAEPHFRYDRIYSALLKKIMEKLSVSVAPPENPSPAVPSGEGSPGLFRSSSPISFWLHIDEAVAWYCRSRGRAVPPDLGGIISVHVQALEEWISGL